MEVGQSMYFLQHYMMIDPLGLMWAGPENCSLFLVCKPPCQHIWLCSMKALNKKLQVSLCHYTFMHNDHRHVIVC